MSNTAGDWFYKGYVWNKGWGMMSYYQYYNRYWVYRRDGVMAQIKPQDKVENI